MPRFATLLIKERKARHTSFRLQFPLHRAVVHHIHNLPDQRWTCQTVIRTRNKIAVFTDHQRERRRITMVLIHHFAHPIRSHINKQHSHRLSTLVSHRHTISCHHTFRPLCIQIRRRPLHRIAPHGNLIKIFLGIIVLFRCNLLHLHRVFYLSAIHLKQFPFRWIIIRLKTNTSPNNVSTTIPRHAGNQHIHIIRVIQMTLRMPHLTGHTHLCLHHDFLNAQS